MQESDSSETNLVIVTKRDRLKLFCKMYWRILIIIMTPLILLPIAFLGTNNAYKCFYAFLVTVTYWISDVMHPSVAALIPIALSSVMGSGFIGEIYIRSELLDCAGVMMIITAIEQTKGHRRAALKLLLVSGCSHYRLSFVLFFMTMFLSMWFSSIVACGLLLPLVKAILTELEKMGILEIYQTIGKAKQKSNRHGQSYPRPTDFTVFYYLGIAYSSSIGGMATIVGNQTNQILKIYCERLFPTGPKIEFPNFMLLNLPGVLVMETILYFWMNVYFLGMCRKQRDLSLEIGMTEEEALYINTLLQAQYKQMGKITYHESIVGTIVLLAALLQPIVSNVYIDSLPIGQFHTHFRVLSPCIFCAVLLFILPRDLSFLKFFKKRSDEAKDSFPQSPSKPCLTWVLVKSNIQWSVLFIIGGSTALFEALRYSEMTNEFEKFLLIFSSWPTAALMLVVILVCKVLSEFAPSCCVAYCLLPNIARLGLLCNVNPHYLMMAATLAMSLPFHLVVSAPANAMVSAYVHIPPWKMMAAGSGISAAAIAVAWFTVAGWAAAVWTEIYREPLWAKTNLLNLNIT